jgi:hypothetical protein
VSRRVYPASRAASAFGGSRETRGSGGS